MRRLLDQIVTEISEKNILDEVTHLMIGPPGIKKLITEYGDLFSAELVEVERDPNKRDLEDYLGVRIIIDEKSNNEEYEFLTKTR